MTAETARRLPRPDTTRAMTRLLDSIEAAFPFDLPPDDLCRGPCTGCSKKLLEFLAREVEDWRQQLQAGELPRLGDLHGLERRARKIARVLAGNGLMAEPER